MNKYKNKKGGFIAKIVLIVIAIIILKYVFHFDLFAWYRSSQVQEIVQPVVKFVKNIYEWLDTWVRNLVNR